jgi:DNA-binding response OmpR family regulator
LSKTRNAAFRQVPARGGDNLSGGPAAPPVPQEEGEASGGAPRPAAKGAHMERPRGRVLYVEDHDDTRVLLALMLRGAGFEVMEAACARDALGLARGGGFDLYLLDHTFPDASGVTVCRALREFDRDTPIVFYSARALDKEREEALNAGAQVYLVKPGDLFNVVDRVGEWIERARETKDST